jgi:hypothetical protein
LSELFLDTELDGTDHDRIAAILVESGYSVEQLAEILYRELLPVLLPNLLSPLGEWAGFDENWLQERILEREPSSKGFAVIPGKWTLRADWKALECKLRGAGR